MFSHHSRLSPLLNLQGSSDVVMSSDEQAGLVRNMVLTDEGTLRSVVGPVPYQQPAVTPEDLGKAHISSDFEGVFYHELESGREILLVHAGRGIYEHQGWRAQGVVWHKLVDGSSPYTTGDWGFPLRSSRSADFLTQFVGTPNGVIIIPQDDDGYGRALFYDGDIVAPLGFDRAPAPPRGRGPEPGREGDTGGTYHDRGNSHGYYVSTEYPRDGLSPEGVRTIPPVFGPNRLGTTQPHPTGINSGAGKVTNPQGGMLSQGEWRCRAQYQDIWGNRSPLSAPSNGVICYQQENVTEDRPQKGLTRDAARMKVQIGWQVDPQAPGGSFLGGMNLYRTKDLNRSADPGYYHVLDYATSGQMARVTLPGATSEFYADNIPDAWLYNEAEELEPVPEFKVACWSQGVLWIGNCKGDPGRIQPSLPGLPGTFPAGKRIYPDTSGEVTALHPVPGGFLAFTRSSCMFVKPSLDSRSQPMLESISSTVGCVSPDSVVAMGNGSVIWLSLDGFYGWAPGDTAPTALTEHLRVTTSRINNHWSMRATALFDVRSGEYRCWVPVDGDRYNNLCLTFDGSSWRERTDMSRVDACCATKCARGYSLALGTATMSVLQSTGGARADEEYESLYLLDHDEDGVYRAPGVQEAVLETGWLRFSSSDKAGTISRITALFRETGSLQAKVEVFRDWRERPIETKEIGSSVAPWMYPTDDAPAFVGSATIGGVVDRVSLRDYESNPHGSDSVRWDRRRPFWQKVDIHVPRCEVFRLRFTFEGDADFVGLRYNEETPTNDIGGDVMPGGQTR